MRLPALLIFSLSQLLAQAQNTSLPDRFKASFKKNGIEKKFAINPYMQQSLLKADFNGDSYPDVAVPVIEKTTKKKGILLLTGKTGQYFVFGAGTKFGSGSDNFTWAKSWEIYDKRTANEKLFNKENGDLVADREVRLLRPAILVKGAESKEFSIKGLIYWDGQKYTWIDQGE